MTTNNFRFEKHMRAHGFKNFKKNMYGDYVDGMVHQHFITWSARDLEVSYLETRITRLKREALASAEHVFKKQIANLEKEVSARDEQIKKIKEKFENKQLHLRGTIKALREKVAKEQRLKFYHKEKFDKKVNSIKDLLKFWDEWVEKHPKHEDAPMIADCATELREVLK